MNEIIDQLDLDLEISECPITITSAGSTYTLSSDDLVSIPHITTTGSSGTITGAIPTSYSFGRTGNTAGATTTIKGYVPSDFQMNPYLVDKILWEEVLPDISTVDNMCSEYPALKKAFENFKTVYTLVEQDYKGKKDDQDEFVF